MKLVALVVIAFVACALSKPTVDLAEHGQAALGFATGVAAVPFLGLGGGAVGFVSGGPKGALSNGASGARTGADIAQTVGGQSPGDYYY